MRPHTPSTSATTTSRLSYTKPSIAFRTSQVLSLLDLLVTKVQRLTPRSRGHHHKVPPPDARDAGRLLALIDP